MGVILSPKHGVNSSVVKCVVCGGDAGLLLNGRLKGDAEAPRYVITGELCNECKAKVDEGFAFIIECRSARGLEDRTGRYVAIKKEALQGDIADVNLMLKDQFEEVFADVIKADETKANTENAR